MKIQNKFAILIAAFVLLKMNLAQAVFKPNQGPGSGMFITFRGGNTPSNVLMQLTEIILSLAGIIALLYIILGGYYYVTSGANEDRAKVGKKYLQNAVIGLIIILLSYTIISVVFTQLT